MRIVDSPHIRADARKISMAYISFNLQIVLHLAAESVPGDRDFRASDILPQIIAQSIRL